MVQFDSLSLDEAESIGSATAFHAAAARRAAEEARFLQDRGAHLVVGDIPPLAFAAAAAAGVPSVALGNFTWDWIYAGYLGGRREALIRTIREAYAHASLALRLPMSGGFEGLESRTRDMPFVARTSHRDPAEVRRVLRLRRSKPMVLTSFGAYGLRNLDAALDSSACADYTVDHRRASRRRPGSAVRLSGSRARRRRRGDQAGLRHHQRVHRERHRASCTRRAAISRNMTCWCGKCRGTFARNSSNRKICWRAAGRRRSSICWPRLPRPSHPPSTARKRRRIISNFLH